MLPLRELTLRRVRSTEPARPVRGRANADSLHNSSIYSKLLSFSAPPIQYLWWNHSQVAVFGWVCTFWPACRTAARRRPLVGGYEVTMDDCAIGPIEVALPTAPSVSPPPLALTPHRINSPTVLVS